MRQIPVGGGVQSWTCTRDSKFLYVSHASRPITASAMSGAVRARGWPESLDTAAAALPRAEIADRAMVTISWAVASISAMSSRSIASSPDHTHHEVRTRGHKSIKEPYLAWYPPYIPSPHTHIPTQKHYILSEEPYVPSKESYIPLFYEPHTSNPAKMAEM